MKRIIASIILILLFTTAKAAVVGDSIKVVIVSIDTINAYKDKNYVMFPFCYYVTLDSLYVLDDDVARVFGIKGDTVKMSLNRFLLPLMPYNIPANK